MTSKKILKKIKYLWIISIVFEAYALINVGNYSVTLFTLITVIALFIGILKGKLSLKTNSQRIAIIISVLCLFNFFITGAKNVYSLMLCEFLFLTYIVTTTDESEQDIHKLIRFFQILVNGLAIYGIYQFVGRVMDWPFSDLYFQNIMVPGYNWTNQITFFGVIFSRSNAIFREPSYFSQVLAINMAIYFTDFIRKNKKKLIPFILNTIAIVCTFSGTGILVFVVGLFLYFLIYERNIKIIIRFSVAIFTTVILIVFITPTTIGQYFVGRFNTELLGGNLESSGSVRFFIGLDVTNQAWKQSVGLGTGIGTVSEFMSTLTGWYPEYMSNSIFRVASELGIFGIISWIIFNISNFKRFKYSRSVVVIICCLLPMLVCEEAFMDNYYWIFLFMLNCRVREVRNEV